MSATGYGLPWWLPNGYLNAEDTRALGDQCLARLDGTCAICQSRRMTDWAHVIRKGMGGRKDGKPEGPRVGLCRECHTGPHGVDRVGYLTMAVTRDGYVDLLVEHDGEVRSRTLGRLSRPC